MTSKAKQPKSANISDVHKQILEIKKKIQLSGKIKITYVFAFSLIKYFWKHRRTKKSTLRDTRSRMQNKHHRNFQTEKSNFRIGVSVKSKQK